MAMPSPQTMAQGSNFLTGASNAAGFGLGTAAANFAASALSPKGVNFRGKYERNVAKHKLEYDPQFIKANTIAGILGKVQGAKEAGLHPLAALGIAPGAGTGSPGPAPIIPGQSEVGSAVESGLNTYMNVKRQNLLAANATKLSTLKVSEQVLRNEWLRTQIARSRSKTLAGRLNSTQPGPHRILETSSKKPHSGKVIIGEAERYPHTDKHSGYSLTGSDTFYQKPGALRGQALEDAVGEIPAGIVSPFLFLQDAGYSADRHIREWFNENMPHGYDPKPDQSYRW